MSDRFDTTGEHENPVDVADVSDEERAEMLARYVELFADEFGEKPRLMPLDEEGKAPIIQGRARLDSDRGRNFLADADEAVRRIREEGARGFAIYAGKPTHGTDEAAFVDHDDMEAFGTPTAEPTLEVLSGSGRGHHETYRNAGDVDNARVTGDDGECGEIRAENWYVVTPGSVHPTGGVYHIAEGREIATLADEDLEDRMRPSGSGSEESEPLSEFEIDEEPSAEKTFKNGFGETLAEIRERSDKLDAVLSDLKPDYSLPNDESRSGYDASAASMLWYWRFDESQIADILRTYRPYEKTQRREYLRRTIQRARGGDRYEPSNGYEPDSVESWDVVRSVWDNNTAKEARKLAADLLEQETAWMYVTDSETLWVYSEDRGYFLPEGSERAAARLESELGTRYSRHHRREIVDRLKQRNQTKRSELNAKQNETPLLCVGNGVVDLATGGLSDHSPKHNFIRGIEWEYDPDADTSPVLRFLDEVTQREADRDTLLDHLAHGLMPGHPYRAFVVMYGPGSNGKTRVGKLFRLFVGKENAASVELQDLTGGDDFATGALPGAFINVGDDVSIGEIRDVSTLKSLSGGASMRANEKYEKQYDFENEAAMFFSANEPPRIAEESQAIGDRLYPIEMPYRFLEEGERDPENPNHKPRTPLIAEKIAADEEAMRGLLALAVEHAQRLHEEKGRYSMPEGPEERRRMYEAASDPIHRFVYEYLEPGEPDDHVAKDDVYAVYKRMCQMQNERATGEEPFKRQITQQGIIDVESTRSRKVTPGDGRARAWRYVRFADDAEQYMPERVRGRYLGDDEPEADDSGGPYGAVSIENAARTLTGYVTVTAEVLSHQSLEGSESHGHKVVLRDETGAIDLIAWDSDGREALRDVEQGATVAVENAELSEYEGARQLRHVENVTEIRPIQQGAGFTEPTDSDSAQLTQAAADGGEAPNKRQFLLKHLRTEYRKGEKVNVPTLAGETSIKPGVVKDRLATIAAETSTLEDLGAGQYEVLE